MEGWQIAGIVLGGIIGTGISLYILIWGITKGVSKAYWTVATYVAEQMEAKTKSVTKAISSEVEKKYAEFVEENKKEHGELLAQISANTENIKKVCQAHEDFIKGKKAQDRKIAGHNREIKSLRNDLKQLTNKILTKLNGGNGNA